MGKLRDRMIEEMTLRNFSAATQKSYLYAVTRLAKYYGKVPDQLSKEDIRAFLVHLLAERKLSPNGLTGYCSGCGFSIPQLWGGARTSCSFHRGGNPPLWLRSSAPRRLCAFSAQPEVSSSACC